MTIPFECWGDKGQERKHCHLERERLVLCHNGWDSGSSEINWVVSSSLEVENLFLISGLNCISSATQSCPSSQGQTWPETGGDWLQPHRWRWGFKLLYCLSGKRTVSQFWYLGPSLILSLSSHSVSLFLEISSFLYAGFQRPIKKTILSDPGSLLWLKSDTLFYAGYHWSHFPDLQFNRYMDACFLEAMTSQQPPTPINLSSQYLLSIQVPITASDYCLLELNISCHHLLLC